MIQRRAYNGLVQVHNSLVQDWNEVREYLCQENPEAYEDDDTTSQSGIEPPSESFFAKSTPQGLPRSHAERSHADIVQRMSEAFESRASLVHQTSELETGHGVSTATLSPRLQKIQHRPVEADLQRIHASNEDDYELPGDSQQDDDYAGPYNMAGAVVLGGNGDSDANSDATAGFETYRHPTKKHGLDRAETLPDLDTGWPVGCLSGMAIPLPRSPVKRTQTIAEAALPTPIRI